MRDGGCSKIIVSLFYFGYMDANERYENYVIVVSASLREVNYHGYENRLAFAGVKHERVTLFMPL